jgi:hypothetical protein
MSSSASKGVELGANECWTRVGMMIPVACGLAASVIYKIVQSARFDCMNEDTIALMKVGRGDYFTLVLVR